MGLALQHLVVSGWGAMIAASGTTNFGLLYWTAGAAVAAWIVTVACEWAWGESHPRTIIVVLKKSRLVTFALLVVLLLIVGAWGVFTVRTVYYERAGTRWAYTREVQRNQELLSQVHLHNRGLTTDDPAYIGLVQILGKFQSYGTAMRGKPCTIVFTSEADSFPVTRAIAEASTLVSKCNTFGPDMQESPDSIDNKEEGMVPGAIVVHASQDNHAAIYFQRQLGNLLPTRYSYTPPKNPHFAVTGDVMWLQFGNGVGWKE